MAITKSEIVFYNSLNQTDDSTNGGLPDYSSISSSGASNNTWPNVLSNERTSGSVLKRKKFFRVEDTEDLSLLNTKIFLTKPTAADDYVRWFVGTQRNTQDDLTGSERLMGVGVLETSVSSGNTIVVTVEDDSETTLFQDGDTIVIHDKSNQEDVAGTRKFFTIDGAPSQVGADYTITTVETIEDSFVAGDAWIATVYDAGTIETSFDNFVVTSTSGTYDESTYPPILNNLGAIEQTWTIEFTSGTTFTVTGDTVGLLGTSGDTSSDYDHNNPNSGYSYFTLESAGFGGTWASGETIVFQTHPIEFAFWQDRIVPVGASSFSSNQANFGVVAESN
ncbi:MAG: hypothetical protein LC687_06335 [Actinobacteria bacterium]|nr:hypothetical protein [Actinomycetota bacterium]